MKNILLLLFLSIGLPSFAQEINFELIERNVKNNEKIHVSFSVFGNLFIDNNLAMIGFAQDGVEYPTTVILDKKTNYLVSQIVNLLMKGKKRVQVD